MKLKHIALAGAGLTLMTLVGCNQAVSPELAATAGSSTKTTLIPLCAPNESVTGITVSPNIPCDYPDLAAVEGVGLARFAWNTLIAMSWPAQDPFAPPYARGVPDRQKQFGQAAPAVVWDTWREKRELFRIVKTAGGYAFAEPPAFNDGKQPSTTGPNPAIPACSPTAQVPQRFVTSLQSNKVENYLDETDEIGLAVLWRGDMSAGNNLQTLGAGTPMPDDDNLVRYQVKFDQTHYSYVRGKKYWDPTTLNAAIAQEQTGGNGIGVELPAGDNATQNTGSILVKTGWKKLSPNEAASGAYYTQTALYYRSLNGTVCYERDEFGLIAIHVIRKTDKFPYFFFSTFQHKGNYPNTFVYANTNGRATKKGEFSSTLKNPFGIPYRDPADPTPNAKNPTVSDPYPANRLIKALPVVVTANDEAAKALAGTVWSNYELVGFQYKPVDAPVTSQIAYYANGSPPSAGGTGAGYFPNYYSDQEYYLANPVVETNQRFQFFEGAFGQTDTKNIALPRNLPKTAPIQAGKVPPTIDMGGCMGCHGNTQNTDFSFTLSNATAQPTGFAAGTIADICAEIGLGYNGINACVAKP